MLSQTIRNADPDKINEFDLETWAHDAMNLEGSLRHEEYVADAWAKRANKAEAESAELREVLRKIKLSTISGSGKVAQMHHFAHKTASEALGD